MKQNPLKNNWGVRELQRQFDSALYTRLVLSRNKNKIKEFPEKGLVIEKPKDAIKDLYILEFLGLPEQAEYSENDVVFRVAYFDPLEAEKVEESS